MTEKLKKAYKAVTDGDILSLSEPQLIEHIQEICRAAPMSTENAITQLNKIHSLCTIYNVKVVKSLNAKNAFLTWVVVILAGFSFASSVIQIYIYLYGDFFKIIIPIFTNCKNTEAAKR